MTPLYLRIIGFPRVAMVVSLVCPESFSAENHVALLQDRAVGENHIFFFAQ